MHLRSASGKSGIRAGYILAGDITDFPMIINDKGHGGMIYLAIVAIVAALILVAAIKWPSTPEQRKFDLW